MILLLSGCIFISDAEHAALLDADGDGERALAFGGADCDDDDPAVGAGQLTYRDADADGFGDPAAETVSCAPTAGEVADATDCDDAVAAIHPGADEVCDAADVDEDCDGAADNADDGVTGALSWYEDADGDRWGATGTRISCDDPGAGWSGDPGDCDDADAEINPGAFEECSQREVDVDCDGRVGDCDVSWAGPVLVGTDGSELGTAVAGTGDLTGDGRADLLVGAPGAGGGSAFLYAPPAAFDGAYPYGTLDVAEAAAWIASDTDGDRLGAAVAGADVTGDGAIDLVVGCPGHDRGGRGDHGVVLVVSDPGGGPLVADLELWGQTAGDAAGSVLATGRDGDLLIGAPGAIGGTGVAYLLRAPLRASNDLSVAVDDGGTKFVPSAERGAIGVGTALALGDLDGDGGDDAVFGIPEASERSAGGGGLYVGTDPQPGAVYLATDASVSAWYGEDRLGRAGAAVAIGDVNGDGFLDLAAGAPGLAQEEVAAGGVLFFLGGAGPLLDEVYARIDGEADTIELGGAAVGTSLAFVGDGNLAVGGPGYGDGHEGADVGAIYILRAGVDPGTASIRTAIDRYVSGPPGSRLGTSIAAAGDVDDDGRADVFVGAPGFDADAMSSGGVSFVLGANIR